MSEEPWIAMDTESNSRHRYPERVCLIQLATQQKVYLIDALAVEDMKPIGELLADDAVVKVIHGADYDMRSVHRQWGFRVRNLFDSSIAARFVGMSNYGLSAVTGELLGIQIAKNTRLQRGDWTQRPLKSEALTYAATDVCYLLDIYEGLKQRLCTLGRDKWVSEECSRLEKIRYIAPDPETAFLSVKGSHRLDGQQKAILKRLFIFRESEARRRDRPPYYVLPNETLIHMATNAGVDFRQLPSLRRQVDTRFGRLVQVSLRKGMTDPPITSPFRDRKQPATPNDLERLHRLKKWRSDQAAQLSIDASLIWPAASLERLSRNPHILEVELESAEVRKWQREQFAGALSVVLTEVRNT